jgi:iron-regulated transporter 1
VGVFAWWQKKPARRDGGYESIAMGDVYRGEENDEG